MPLPSSVARKVTGARSTSNKALALHKKQKSDRGDPGHAERASNVHRSASKTHADAAQVAAHAGFGELARGHELTARDHALAAKNIDNRFGVD